MVLDSLAGAEVAQLEDLADFNVALSLMRVRTALDPFDRLRKRFALQDPVGGELCCSSELAARGPRALCLAFIVAL